MRNRLQKKSQKAVALVMVLLVIALVSILVMSYLSSMQIERRASNSYADTQRAKMVTQGAVAHAIELLRTNIPDPAGIDQSAGTAPAQNWVINPGRLTVFDESGSEKIVPLHTGGADKDPGVTADPDVYSVDLNEPVPGKVEPSITYDLDENGEALDSLSPPAMRVKWVNILKDPSEPASEENPVVARHAFWIDDECNKLNFNTAMGKTAPGVDPAFDKQYELGMMPALFRYTTGQANRHWALGKLRSVNLDVLFDDPSDLDKGDLLAHVFYRGHNRHPEGILGHLNMDEKEKTEWWHRNRYHLTSYSRSPEFNVFGRPRFMTTNIPLSLEGGPYYQMPFVYNGPGAPDTLHDLKGVLHLHSLMGSLGFTHGINDGSDEGGSVHAANIVNRAQASMLMRYFQRTFPGYSGSFVDKYGEAECAQIALNILNMARYATTTMRDGSLNGFSLDQSLRSTSVLYSPHQQERNGSNPERHYWRFQPGNGDEAGRFLARGEDSASDTVPMIPSTPGPHIMEVRLVFKPFVAKEAPTMAEGEGWKNHPLINGDPVTPPQKWLGFRFETEYYLQGGSSHIRTHYFPFKVDYFKMELTGEGLDFRHELGPPNPEDADDFNPYWSRNWNHDNRKRHPVYDENGDPTYYPPGHEHEGKQKFTHPVRLRNLGSLKVQSRFHNNAGNPILNTAVMRPYDPSLDPEKQTNRFNVRGPWRFVGTHPKWLPNIRYPYPKENQHLEPRRFNHLEMDDTSVKVKVTFRGGMGVHVAGSRPRQMIPLGEREEDTLEGEVTVDLMNPQPVSISWQIVDPQLSSHRDMWTVETSDDDQAGTPGQLNTGEPEEGSTEKSKFRYLPQRGPGSIAGQVIQRPDEYDSRSRVASKGFWSVLPTGIQNKVPWRTLRLSPAEPDDPAGPPDYLLMDLFGGTYPLQHNQWVVNSTLPDEFSTVSYMHSTTGAVNLNTKTFPDESPYFSAPQRRKPIEGVFKHLRSDANINEILDGIAQFQESDRFKYVGEASEVPGFLRGADETQFHNEELLRNMIGCLTTRSNTFGIWGVGQVVQKVRGNEEWGEFEDGDSVRGEKRFFALVERYIWPGKDGVPGNAHVDSTGEWDRSAVQTHDVETIQKRIDELGKTFGGFTDRLFGLPGSPPTRVPGLNNDSTGRRRLDIDYNGTYPEYDGPQEVEMDRYASRALGKVKWRGTPLEEAYNPPHAVIKYRVVYFKYLDE